VGVSEDEEVAGMVVLGEVEEVDLVAIADSMSTDNPTAHADTNRLIA
jgi:hypothetical protein